MSLSTALNSAMTGLTAASKSTSVVSDNIANALTEGYRTRVLDLQSNGGIGGVRVGSVGRLVDPAIQKSVRASETSYYAAEVSSTFYSGMADLVGSVNDEYSIAQRLTDFESALIEATSMPDSDARLNDVAMQAEELAMSLKEAADGVSTLRNKSEESIAGQIDNLQTNLERIDELNTQVLSARISGLDTSGLEDQRDRLVSEVNKVIPVQVYDRANDQLALYTKAGVKLLDGSVAQIEFDETPLVTPYMTQGNGQLSGLTIDGKAIDTSVDGKIGGGTLAATFYVRDVAAVEAQADLDTVASDLILRFQDPAVDPTLGATDIGIFTDEGVFYDTANEMGIANRIQINSVIAMSGDGETWRLRDGLNATAIGEKGDTTILNNYLDGLNESKTISSPGLGSGDYNAFAITTNLMNGFTQKQTWADQDLAFTSSSYTDLKAREAEQGVDTDAELQTLMMIETIYGANARMLQAIDEMMQELLRL